MLLFLFLFPVFTGFSFALSVEVPDDVASPAILADRPNTLKEGESVSTQISTYPEFVKQATIDPAVFAEFKRHPAYKGVVTTVSDASAEKILSEGHCLSPEVKEKLPAMASLDAVGKPETVTRLVNGHTLDISNTMLRYAYHASELLSLFGSVDKMHVVEVGGGYGGLASAVSTLSTYSKWDIVDLAVAQELQRQVSKASQTPNVGTPAVNATIPSDLFVSAYAFTELEKSLQKSYLDNFLVPASRGWIQLNFEAHAQADGRMGSDEILHLLQTKHPDAELVKGPFCDSNEPSRIYWGHKSKF